jgi:arylsulfatase A-like enzyme
MAASRVLGGTGGMGLLLSGLPSLLIASAVLYTTALLISPRFYDAIDHVQDSIVSSFRQCFALLRKNRKITEEHELLISAQEDQLQSETMDEQHGEAKNTNRPSSNVTSLLVAATTLGVSILVSVLQIVRPITQPYAHMSGSLPITLIEAALFQPINSEFCLPHPVDVVLFPFERFTKFFEMPPVLDWMPTSINCSRDNGPRPPPWQEFPGQDGRNDRNRPGPGPHGRPAPPRPPHGPPGHPHGPPPHGPPPHGPPGHGPPGHGINGPPGGPPHGPHAPYGPRMIMARDEPPEDDNFAHEHFEFRHGGGSFGGNDCEPLKLSNLDANILEPLAAQIKIKQPKIRHVLLLTLESTRKDMFPFKKNSHAYETVLSTYTSPDAHEELDAKLRGFTDTAAFLSGDRTGFEPKERRFPRPWQSDFKEGMGAININGAVSQAAYTLKSLLSSHCGVEPLAVDFAEETKGTIYQHCLAGIFKKMSSVTPSAKSDEKTQDGKRDHRSLPWAAAMVQAVTDEYDSQDVLDKMMGFDNVIAESTISDPHAAHYPPQHGFINYFGYAETETHEYLRDLFVNAKKTEERLFVSHLTSTPHHPFKTPNYWDSVSYMSDQRWRPSDPFNDYMNTIQYQDEWISMIFGMLHDVGAIEETLVVITGDHGLAFNSLDNSQSAVNNGHIGNFEIPILLVHPDLPRIQLNASVTPTSILPTILDLLLETDSLPERAQKVARDILPGYQGLSLIRDQDYRVKTADNASAKAFFQPFHFSAINPGGSLLAISDGATPYRLVLPLCSTIALRFTDLSSDPHEWEPITAWTMDELRAQIKVRHGERASQWAQLAEEMGRWWVWDSRDRWGYWGEARETSRGGADVGGGRGGIKKHHWWETKK